MTRYVALTIALLAVCAAPASGAAGPYAGADVGADGVTIPGLASRYVALRTHGGTIVMQVDRSGGRIRGSRLIDRRLVIPAVAFDGSATGLSGDGTTLVLASPRDFDGRRSTFLVLDTQRLSQRATIALRGDFTLDAISPDGNLLFLIETMSPDDLTSYAVRVYDVAERRLLPDPIVDPEEADEPMRGNPLSRAMSSDGRWAYTLYDGDGGHPFIHALDTVEATAKCIDLDALTGHDDLIALRLTVESDGAVAVRQPDLPEPLLTVNPQPTGWLATMLAALKWGQTPIRAPKSGSDPVRDNVRSYAASRLERDLV